MKSNDSIPADELLLAEAIAAARARGLKGTRNTYYESGDDSFVLASSVPVGVTACCAVGAIHLASHDGLSVCDTERRLERQGFLVRAITTGNDNDDPMWSDCEGDGESLGWAFRCAMEDSQ